MEYADNQDDDGHVNTVVDTTIDVTVEVTDLDEPGEITLSSQQPQVDTELTATLKDADGGVVNESWQWEIYNDGTSNWDEISGRPTSDSYIPVLGDVDKRLRVTVTYTDGHGTSGKTAQAEPNNAVRADPGANVAPTFPTGGSEDYTRSIPENTVAGEDIGLPVTATDSDPADVGNLNYSLDPTSATVFDIVPTTGQLQTRATLNYEDTSIYTVTVTATDPSDDTATVEVTINVTDVNEPPGKPDAPELAPEATDGHSKLTAILTAPTNTGPRIISYTFAHRKHDVEEWESQDIPIILTDGVPPTTLGITMLLPETTYFARFKATNDEGDGEWSDEGSGTTAIKPEGEWFDLTVDYDADTYSVTERQSVTITVQLSAEADRKLAIPITDTVGTAETSDYAVGGLTNDALPFVPGETSKTFTITANSDTDTDDETLTLGFDSPLPNKVTAGSQTTAVVTIDDTTSRNNNPGGGGGGGGSTNQGNRAPVFGEGSSTARSVEENTTSGTNIGLPVNARDSDNDSLTYTISGADGSSFDIDGSTGHLKTKDTLDHETQSSYTVTVTARDPSGDTDTITVTITVTDVDEKPGKPDAPTLAPASSDGHDALTVTWTAPNNTGPDITSYAIQYRKHDVQEWTDVTGPIAGTTATVDISDLLPDTTYFARVQATSDEGTGEWSEEGEGTTAVTPVADQVELTVYYAAATYSVTEGSTVNITVDLSPEADRKLSIPHNHRGGCNESGRNRRLHPRRIGRLQQPRLRPRRKLPDLHHHRQFRY